MKAVRMTRSLILAIALVASLGANVTLFVGGVVYSFVDEFVEHAFGLATDVATQRRALNVLKTSSAKQAKALAASKAVVARQRGELSTLRAAGARQRRDIVKLEARSGKQQRQIAALKAAAAKQGKTLSALKTDVVRQGRQLGSLRHAATSAALRSRDRLVKAVGRSILTAPGKALPYAGVPIVVGLTVWEIRDLCATVRDMDEIHKAAAEAGAEAETEAADCSRPDLAVEHAVNEIGNSSRKAWEESKKYVPHLPGWEDIPERWRDAWRSTVPYPLRNTWDDLKRLFP